MYKYLLILPFVCITAALRAQSDTVNSKISKIPYKHVDAVAKFPQGDFKNYIIHSLQTNHTVEYSVRGQIILLMSIDADGGISHVSVLKSLSPQIDPEVVRVINASPKWKPAMLNGQKVSMDMVLNIDIAINGIQKPAAKPVVTHTIAPISAKVKPRVVAKPVPLPVKIAALPIVKKRVAAPAKKVAPPVIKKPTPPIVKKVVSPVVKKPVPHVVKKVVPPVVKKPVPVKKVILPIAKKVIRPVVKKPVPVKKAAPPVIKKPVPPIVKKVIPPVVKKPVPHIVKKAIPPVVKKTVHVVAKKIIIPVAKKIPHIAKEPKATKKAEPTVIKKHKRIVAKMDIFRPSSNAPVFPGGGLPAFLRYLGDNISYPPDSKKAGIEGKVLITFTIEEDGSVNDVEVVSSPAEDLSQEATRVMLASPKWKPATQNGRNVPVSYTIPIKFTLASPKTN